MNGDAYYDLRPLTDAARAKMTRSELDREGSPFKADWGSTLELLDRECRMLQRRPDLKFVAMIDVDEAQFRLDGNLRASAKSLSPRAAIAFEGKQGPLLFTCDKFYRWRDNVRAIALGLEALRKVERYGMGKGTEQYAGFGELPSGIAMPSAMTVEEAKRILLEAAGGREDSMSWLDVYRRAVRKHHPDVGGAAATFRRLTEARDLLNNQGAT